MWPARAALGLTGQKKKSPSTLPVVLKDENTGEVTKSMLPPSLAAAKVVLPTWEGPRFFMGPSPDGKIHGGHWCSVDPAALGEDIIVVKINVALVARAIAKIAHCTAVAAYGLDGFVPFLPKLILGEDDRFDHFVGCVETPADREDTTHWSKLHTYDHPTEGRTIVGRVRLFANLGAPVYHSAVGRLPATLDQLDR